MSKPASLLDVRDFFSTLDRPVSMTEMKELTSADRDELRTLVGEHLNK